MGLILKMEFYKVNQRLENLDLEKYQYPNRRIGVIVHITDENGKILLQQREIKSVKDRFCNFFRF